MRGMRAWKSANPKSAAVSVITFSMKNWQIGGTPEHLSYFATFKHARLGMQPSVIHWTHRKNAANSTPSAPPYRWIIAWICWAPMIAMLVYMQPHANKCNIFNPPPNIGISDGKGWNSVWTKPWQFDPWFADVLEEILPRVLQVILTVGFPTPTMPRKCPCLS